MKRFSKFALLLTILAVCSFNAFSQALNGTYTIGGTSPSYATLSAAVADLNTKGVSGPVIFNIRSGTYSGANWKATLNAITGASATNRITIKSEANNALAVSISDSSTTTTNNFVIKLNKACFVTLKDLTLNNLGATYGRVVEFADSSSSDSIVNCIITSKTRTGTSVSSNAHSIYATSFKGSNNVVKGNTFTNNSYGISYVGNTTTNANNLVVADNIFQNQHGYGIYVTYTKDVKIISNTVITNSAYASYIGIQSSYCDGPVEVTKNKVSGAQGGYGIYVYYCEASASNMGIVANNVISVGSGTNTTKGLTSYNCNYHKIYNNSVNVTSTGTTNATAAGYFYNSSATYENNEIRNNVLSNKGGGFAMYVYNPTYANTFDYNNLYTTGAKLVARGTPAADFANLTAWRAAYNFDLNSISFYPGFTSATNLTPNPGNDSSWSLNGRGIHIPGNDKDVNGNPRAVLTTAGVPDIGAYEFIPTVLPPAAVATPAAPAAGITQVFTFGLDTVATIAWSAAAAVPATITVKQYTGTAPAGISAVSPTSMFFYTDIVAPAGTYNYTGNVYYKEPWIGSIAAESALRLVKKNGANPWQPFSPAVSGADVDRNFISTPNLTDFGLNTGIDVANNAGVSEITEPTGFLCAGSVPVKVKVKNAGSNILNSVQINWQVNGVTQTPLNYSTAIPVNGETIVTIGNVTFANGLRTVKVWTSLPNNGLDPIGQDDTVTATFRDGLSGTFTIGGTTPDYPTIASAVNALNQYGVCGPVTFNIRNGIYTEQAQLNAVNGESLANRITFKAESGNPANVTMTYDATGTADNYVFRIGASNVSVKDITIAPKDSTYMRGLELTAAASNDSIINCRLTGLGTTKSSNNAALIFVDNMTGKKNVIKGNIFSYGSYGLFYSGTSTTNLADSATIADNIFQDQYVYAAYFYYTNNLKVDNNTITTNSASTAFYGVHTYYGDGAIQITNNKIRGALGGYGIYQYYSDATAAAKGIIANNVISIGSGTNTTHGLRSNYSSYQRVYNNSVNITSTSAANGIAGYFYYSSATYENNEIKNNVFSNTGGGYAMYVYNPTYANTFDYNNLYTKGPKLVDRGTPAADYATLTAWRAAHGVDMNSISFNPGFTSATDLTPNPANDSSWSLNGRGVQLAGNNKDINGIARAVITAAGVPDIGAYEFTPTVIPPVAVASPAAPAAGSVQVFTFGEDTVASIEWSASAAVPSSIDVRQYTGTLPVGINSVSTRSMYYYTDIAVPSGTYGYNSSIYYKEPWMGTIAAAEQALRLAKNDDGANPWTVISAPISVTDVTRNLIYTTGLTDFGHNTGVDIANNAGIGSITSPTGLICTGTYPVKVILKNNGSNVLNNVKVNWQVDGVSQTTLNYNTPLAVNSQVEVTLGNVAFINGGHTVKVWTSEPNGAIDSVSHDDTASVTLRDGLAGVYTIGGTNPDYATINDAVNELHKYGICAAVTFNIRNGNYNEQITLGNVAGLSANSRITFTSEANDPSAVVINFQSTAAANNFVFRLDNVSYITLKNLTFRNTGTTFGRVLQMIGTVSNDSVLNSVFEAPIVTTSSTNTAVLFADPLTGGDNTFINNDFRNGAYGLYYQGTSQTVLSNNNVFLNNRLTDQYSYATNFYYTNDLKFKGNIVTTNSTYTSFYGIYSYYGDGALEITNNTVTGMQGGYGMNLYYSDGAAGRPGIVANNVVTFGAASNTANGIRSYYGSYQRIYNNSVNITSSSLTAGYAGYFYYNAATTSNNEIKNNVFANTGGGYAMFVYDVDPTYNNSWDYNNLYTTGPKLVDRGTPATDYATLSDWRIASQYDMNSISYDPGFVSNADLRPNPANPASWSLNGRGVHIAGNDVDFNGSPRVTKTADGVPDIGAYEFIPTTLPPLATATPATPAPGTKQVFTFGQDTVATINWHANSAVPSSISVSQYTGTIPPQFPSSRHMYFYTDIDAQNGSYNYDAEIYYKNPWIGKMAGEKKLRMLRKPAGGAWQAYNDNASSVDSVRNLIMANGATTLGWFTGIEDSILFSAIIKPVSPTVICTGNSVVLKATNGKSNSYVWMLNGNPIPGADSSSYTAIQAGDYTVAVTNVSGVTATSDKVSVTVVAGPSALITPAGALNICSGGTLQLNANLGAGLKYQWSVNGTPIAGATNASHTATSAGNYTVMVSNISCAAVSAPIVVTQGPLDVRLGTDTAFCQGAKPYTLNAGYTGAKYTWSTGDTSQTADVHTAGSYWVKVETGAGCVGVDTIVLDIDPLPTVVGISYSRQGGNYQFSASGVQNANRYLWIFDKNGAITTVNDPIPPAQIYDRSMAVTLVVFNDCGSDTVTLVNWSTGIEDATKESTSLNVYPNPATEKVTVKAEDDLMITEVTVVNAVGQVIYKQPLVQASKQVMINVSAFAPGNYIIRTNTSHGMVSKPLNIVR